MARAPLGDSLLRSPQKSADFRGPRLEKSYTKGIAALYEWRVAPMVFGVMNKQKKKIGAQSI